MLGVSFTQRSKKNIVYLHSSGYFRKFAAEKYINPKENRTWKE